MAKLKKVELVYHNGRKFVKEICELGDYDSPVYTFDGERLPDEITEQYKKDGFVMFEDEEGLFLVPGFQIKYIKVLEE